MNSLKSIVAALAVGVAVVASAPAYAENSQTLEAVKKAGGLVANSSG